MNYGAKVIFNQVLSAMQDAEEIGGVEDEEYLDLMEAIRHEAVKRFNNCVDLMALNQEAKTNLR